MNILGPQHHARIYARFIDRLGPAALPAWGGAWDRFLRLTLAEACVRVASEVAPDPRVIDLDFAAPGHPDGHGRQDYFGFSLVHPGDGGKERPEALIRPAPFGCMTEYQAREMLRKRAAVRIMSAPYGQECPPPTLADLIATFTVASIEMPDECVLLIAWNEDAHPDADTEWTDIITGIDIHGGEHRVIPPP